MARTTEKKSTKSEVKQSKKVEPVVQASEDSSQEEDDVENLNSEDDEQEQDDEQDVKATETKRSRSAVVIPSLNTSQECQTLVDELLGQLKVLQTKLNKVNDRFKQLRKSEMKKGNKTQKSDKPRENYGFMKEEVVPDNVIDFLNEHCEPEEPYENGVQLSRRDVAREIHKYCEANELRAEGNRKDIVCDKNLATLFKITKDELVEFGQFQTYLARSYHDDWKEREATKAAKKAKDKAETSGDDEEVEETKPVKEVMKKSQKAGKSKQATA